MVSAKLAAKLPVLLPRALAGDPAAIAILVAGGIYIGVEFLKKNT